MQTRRNFVFASLVLAATPALAQQRKISPSDFLGQWVGKWNDRWNMSLRVESVKGDRARVHYTHPDGANDMNGTIAGNTLKVGAITLTLSSATSGTAVGRFPTATRTAAVAKE